MALIFLEKQLRLLNFLYKLQHFILWHKICMPQRQRPFLRHFTEKSAEIQMANLAILQHLLQIDPKAEALEPPSWTGASIFEGTGGFWFPRDTKKALCSALNNLKQYRDKADYSSLILINTGFINRKKQLALSITYTQIYKEKKKQISTSHEHYKW